MEWDDLNDDLDLDADVDVDVQVDTIDAPDTTGEIGIDKGGAWEAWRAGRRAAAIAFCQQTDKCFPPRGFFFLFLFLLLFHHSLA